MILIISPEPWDGHDVSKHHYARELARRGHRVLFHGPPENGPLRLEPAEVNGAGRLEILHSNQVSRGLRWLPNGLKRAKEARWLKRVEQLAGAPVTVVWLFENSRFYDMRFAKDRLKIYHQVDLNQDFHPEEAASTADFVFCTSHVILDRLRPHNSTARFIQHGVQTAVAQPDNEKHLFESGKLNCLYVGNLSIGCLDRSSMLECLDVYPDFAFHFVGGFRSGDPFKAALSAKPNAAIHGKVASHRIPSIISNADILLVTYAKEYFDDQVTNPHKMMEYMMGGKVTVATFTKEYEPVSDLLAMEGPDGDYVALLGRVASNIEFWNSPDRIAQRKAFAHDNTYPRQLDRIAASIGPKSKLIS